MTKPTLNDFYERLNLDDERVLEIWRKRQGRNDEEFKQPTAVDKDQLSAELYRGILNYASPGLGTCWPSLRDSIHEALPGKLEVWIGEDKVTQHSPSDRAVKRLSLQGKEEEPCYRVTELG